MKFPASHHMILASILAIALGAISAEIGNYLDHIYSAATYYKPNPRLAALCIYLGLLPIVIGPYAATLIKNHQKYGE